MGGLPLGLGQAALSGSLPCGQALCRNGVGLCRSLRFTASSSFLSLQLEFGDFLVFKYISPFLKKKKKSPSCLPVTLTASHHLVKLATLSPLSPTEGGGRFRIIHVLVIVGIG